MYEVEMFLNIKHLGEQFTFSLGYEGWGFQRHLSHLLCSSLSQDLIN